MNSVFLRQIGGFDTSGNRFVNDDSFRMGRYLSFIFLFQMTEKFIPLDYSSKTVSPLPKGSIQTFMGCLWEASEYQFLSLMVHRGSLLAMNVLFFDITYNLYNEPVDFCWSSKAVERIKWILDSGKSVLKKSLYDELKSQDASGYIDLTTYRASDLMALSISGLVCFTGLNDGVYRLTGDRNAPFRIHGNLPVVRIRDLVILGLVASKSYEVFLMGHFPGLDYSVKAVSGKNRTFLLRTGQNTYGKSFIADESQVFG